MSDSALSQAEIDALLNFDKKPDPRSQASAYIDATEVKKDIKTLQDQTIAKILLDLLMRVELLHSAHVNDVGALREELIEYRKEDRKFKDAINSFSLPD